MVLILPLALSAKFDVSLTKNSKSLNVVAPEGKSKTDLMIPKGFFVEENLKVFSSENFHLVQVTLSDNVVYTTRLLAFDDKGKNIWGVDLKSFNPSTPLIEGDAVFLAAHAIVMKVNKSDGKTLWKHNNLYGKSVYEFNGAGSISRRGPYITFAKNLVVDDRNGKIVEVKQ